MHTAVLSGMVGEVLRHFFGSRCWVWRVGSWQSQGQDAPQPPHSPWDGPTAGSDWAEGQESLTEGHLLPTFASVWPSCCGFGVERRM